MSQEIENEEILTECINAKARELVRSKLFGIRDENDIGQELWLLLLRKRASLVPTTENKKAFFQTVVRNAGRDLLDRMKTRKETFQRSFAELDANVGKDEDGYPITRGCLLDDSRLDPVDEMICAERRAAFDAELSDDQRALVERLENGSQSTVAREMNLPRSTFRDGPLQSLRDAWHRIEKK